MKKKIAAVILGAAVLAQALAAESTNNLEDKYFGKDSPTLSQPEKEALAVAKKAEASTSGMKPFPGAQGAVRFQFGAQTPHIVCAVLQICDVSLQAGEQVNSIQLGDSARWSVEPAISGYGSTEVQHLIIKPLDVGLETMLVVATNRRTYHLKLRSHRTKFMPQIAFSYPDDAAAQWHAIRQRAALDHERKIIPETGEYLGDLSFNYDVDGAVAWKPVRVYNDGRKTIIEMPRAMSQTEAPSLLVVRRDGGLFSDDEMVMVNYRLQGERYIVDSVFDKAVLIAGVGDTQDRVTITRRKP